MFTQIWLLPAFLLGATALLAIPLSRYLAWVMEGKYHAPRWLRWFEARLDSGPQNWKQYTVALLLFNAVMFVFSFAVLALQPHLPLNPDGKGMLWPTTIFNTVISFITNSDIQHYAGETHFSNFSQIFFLFFNQFLSASVGFCALVAIVRMFRGEKTVGNYFVDMWRVVMYVFLPLSLLLGVFFVQQGLPMTFQKAPAVATLEPGAMGTADNGDAKPQTIVLGPVAAMEGIKMLGTNGGGFYSMNSAHPYENPTAASNVVNSMSMLLFPFALVLMYGSMLGRRRHGWAVFAVMMVLMAGTIVWSVYFDALKPNPGLTAHPTARTYEFASATAPDGRRIATLPAVAGLPVDQHLGNLEGKELRFGTSAGAVYSAITTDVTTGAINAEMDSLNPMAGISPMTGMWLNCIFGGKGVGIINMLMYVIIGIFIAGMMVGRTPEYLGKKIGKREVALAIVALLLHPLLILMPTGLFAATDWGMKATSNPGPHGFAQIFYQFSSDSANNGSAFDGLGTVYGLANNASPAPQAIPWDIAAGLVMAFGRYLPILAMMAMAAFLGAKKSSPFGVGSLRDDTPTFAILLCATILIVGALLFLPIAALGPLAEHFGPIPFGG